MLPVEYIEPPEKSQETTTPVVTQVDISEEEVIRRKEKLRGLNPEPEALNPTEKGSLMEFLADHHQAFCLNDNERGETDLLQFDIDTRGALPRRHAPRRMPFAVRQELARQLKNIQEIRVVQPSNSPWASPVVMVWKDGTHRFCMDYRDLNAVTRADTFPLPRIDDLLDQLSNSRYFSTLNLASGYW